MIPSGRSSKVGKPCFRGCKFIVDFSLYICSCEYSQFVTKNSRSICFWQAGGMTSKLGAIQGTTVFMCLSLQGPQWTKWCVVPVDWHHRNCGGSCLDFTQCVVCVSWHDTEVGIMYWGHFRHRVALGYAYAFPNPDLQYTSQKKTTLTPKSPLKMLKSRLVAFVLLSP